MSHLSWTAAASNELYRVYQYRSDQDSAHAAALVDTIVAEVQLLRRFPKLGRLACDGSGNRELILTSRRRAYVVVYEILPDVISILSVRDSRRDDRVVVQ